MLPTNALEMSAITKTYPGVQALDRVDFAVRSGEIHALMGENGAGKSTLMKILFGAVPRDSGQILIKGNPVEIRNPADAQRLGVSMVHQELHLVPQMNAAQNIFLGRAPTLDPLHQVLHRRSMTEGAEKLLAQVGAQIDVSRPVRELSIAQRQMIEIAKALSYKADVLVMDEPTSSLTDHEIDELFRALRKLTADGVAVVFISHRLEEVFTIADRITVLRDGRNVGTVERAAVRPDDVIRMMVGRDLQEMYPKHSTQPGSEALRLEKVSATGEQGRVLDNISFSARQGEIVGIVGLVGAGRAEVARALFGCLPKMTGTIMLHGKAVKLRSPHQAIQHGVGLLTADRKGQGLVLGLPVQHNVSLANLNALTKFGVIDFGRRQAVAQQYRKELDIRTPDVLRPVRALSGGNQQKVVLAKWLFSQSRILIFEEPTRGVDVGAKVEIYQLMNQLAAQGVCILMISSELPEVLGMSDRVLAMRSGKIVLELARAADGSWPAGTKEQVLHAAMGEVEHLS